MTPACRPSTAVSQKKQGGNPGPTVAGPPGPKGGGRQPGEPRSCWTHVLRLAGPFWRKRPLAYRGGGEGPQLQLDAAGEGGEAGSPSLPVGPQDGPHGSFSFSPAAGLPCLQDQGDPVCDRTPKGLMASAGCSWNGEARGGQRPAMSRSQLLAPPCLEDIGGEAQSLSVSPRTHSSVLSLAATPTAHSSDAGSSATEFESLPLVQDFQQLDFRCCKYRFLMSASMSAAPYVPSSKPGANRTASETSSHEEAEKKKTKLCRHYARGFCRFGMLSHATALLCAVCCGATFCSFGVCLPAALSKTFVSNFVFLYPMHCFLLSAIPMPRRG